MNILSFINENIISYIYIIIGIVLLVFIIKLVTKLKTTSKYTAHISDKVNDIQEEFDSINRKIEKVEETKEKSLPLFIDIFLVSIIARAVFKDYKKTKTSRRSVAKSTIKEYLRYQDIFRFKTPKLIKGLISTIKKVA